MANKFSKLNIDSSKLPSWINTWCEDNLEEPFAVKTNDIENRIQYIINTDTRDIKLDFQKCNGGLLTICPNVGKHQEISKEIAESFKEEVTVVSFFML